MRLFYTPNFSAQNNQLSESESQHCLRVLRMKSGERIQVTDGKGKVFSGSISILSKAVFLEVDEEQVVDNTRNYYLHLAIAPTKQIERLEWFLEKATEIGIDEISLIQTQNSERKRVRMDRLERILVSAMKQSKQYRLPKLNDLQSFSEFMNLDFSESQNWISHCDGNFERQIIKNEDPKQNICILIGPEGDFSPQEIEQAYQAKFRGLRLGDNRLRTETAGIVACQLIQSLHYD
ncbi:MAG: 16S rRNA (uracil(1498)-N(3))-methyltransferase [Flavobacteriales bacterium]